MNSGLCECGCGQITSIAKQTREDQGYKQGEHVRFLKGHHNVGKTKDLCYNWKGGKWVTERGYVMIRKPKHPRANHGYVPEQVLVVEKVLGKLLPPQAIVHHVDGNTGNNKPNNLVVCENNSYHRILHHRKQAYENCGHADWVKCLYCKKYDSPNNMYIRPIRKSGWHRECRNLHILKEKK